jgi:hypothetical protein
MNKPHKKDLNGREGGRTGGVLGTTDFDVRSAEEKALASALVEMGV